MKLSQIGTDRIAERTAQSDLDYARQQVLDGKLGKGAIYPLEAALAAAQAVVIADMVAYDANPEPEV